MVQNITNQPCKGLKNADIKNEYEVATKQILGLDIVPSFRLHKDLRRSSLVLHMYYYIYIHMQQKYGSI